MSEYVNSIFTLGLVSALGLAIGYAGQWTKTELNPRNVIVLLCWIGLIFVLGFMRLFPNLVGNRLTVFVTMVGVAFIFAVFALYRHRDNGNLGDSQEAFRIATYNLNYGNPEGLNLSYPLSKLLNQALFDIGFHRLWLIPLFSGVLFFCLLLLSPTISKQKLRVTRSAWLLSTLLLFLASSVLLYFFRSYMEFYFFGGVIMGLGLIITIRGIRSNSLMVLFLGGALLGAAPLFHILFAIFLIPPIIWISYWLHKTKQSRNRLAIFAAGCVTPVASFGLLIIIFQIPTNFGSINSLSEPGALKPDLLNFSTWQLGLLIAFVSAPIIYLTITYIYSRTRQKLYLSDMNQISLSLVAILASQWTMYVTAYWFLNGYDTDRDHVIAMVVPLLMLLVSWLNGESAKHNAFVTYSFVLSGTVTAAVVTSFIEPAWY